VNVLKLNLALDRLSSQTANKVTEKTDNTVVEKECQTYEQQTYFVPVNLPKSSFNSLGWFAQGLANEVPNAHLTLLQRGESERRQAGKAAFRTKSARRAKRR